jgi:hypothetical protein
MDLRIKKINTMYNSIPYEAASNAWNRKNKLSACFFHRGLWCNSLSRTYSFVTISFFPSDLSAFEKLLSWCQNQHSPMPLTEEHSLHPFEYLLIQRYWSWSFPRRWSTSWNTSNFKDSRFRRLHCVCKWWECRSSNLLKKFRFDWKVICLWCIIHFLPGTS